MKRSSQAGLTLMEILIAVTLLGLVAASFAYLFDSSQRYMVQSVNISATQGEASFALEHIERNLQLASAVALPLNVGDSGQVLEFTSQLSISAPVITSRYYMNGTFLQFIRDTGNGAWENVARNISAITFTRSTLSTIDIQVQAQQTSVGGGDTRNTTLRTSVSPRGLL